MAGNVGFESSPANADELAFGGTHSNVQRGNHLGASLDRSGSFREGSEGRMFSSPASNLPRGSSPLFGDMPPVSQCLVLEPFLTVDPKYPKSGELRKVLGIAPGNSSEDGSFEANHAKLPHQVVPEELKRFKLREVDASGKARTRLKKLDESLLKLNKYCDALNSKKQQRSELLINERSGGSNLKAGSQLHRNSSDLSAHRLEDRAKNAPLNKRFRSSVAELRGESQGSTLMRQSFAVGKDRDLDRDGSESSDPPEEKIQRLPAGGDGWEKKMKRKRSIGTVFARSVEGDGEVKRATQKVKNNSCQQFSDAQTLRSGSLNGAGGMNKSDSSPMPPGLNMRMFSKNEQEKVSLQRDFSPASTKDRAIARGNNKLTIREDAAVQNPSPLTKGKASRTPRSSSVSVAAVSSTASLPRASGGLESWEQSPSVPKVHLVGAANSNRKRSLPSGLSSSPPMKQWAVQRPQKMPRSRRANVVSPILNNDDIPNSSEGCASDLGPKMASMSRGFASGVQQLKVKLENVSSPLRLSESEESGAGESHGSRLKEKRAGNFEVDERDVVPIQNVGSSGGPLKKSKMTSRDENGDAVQREGRSGRGPLSARASSSPSREKLENTSGSKPHRSMRVGSDKSGSKSGRPPLKKLSERKVFARPGKSPGISNPDFSGESEDDREELLAAASFASSANYFACTGNFWKKMEPVFASISSEDISYLEQQVKSSEELHNDLLKKLNISNNLKGIPEHEENSTSQRPFYGAGDDNSQVEYAPKEPDGSISFIEDDIISIYGSLDPGGMKVIPITQRLLASLIVEDEAMVEGDCEGKSTPFQQSGDNHISCLPVSGHLRDNNYSIDYDYHFVSSPQTHNQLGVERSCNGVVSKNIFDQSNCDIYQEGYGQLIHRERVSVEINENGYSCEEQYRRISVENRALLELHSVGLYPENVPDLADGEDDPINSEIFHLHKKLIQKIDTKRAHLSQLFNAVGKGDQTFGRDLERIAMDKLIEAAYKKQLATRQTYALKRGIPKVPKHVAMAFTKRALSKCRKFEDTGKSCFSESPFIETLSAPPPRLEESMDCAKLLETASNSKPESGVTGPLSSKVDGHDLDHGSSEVNGTFVRSGPLQNRGKKKEVLLDDIGGKPSSLRIPPGLGNTFSGGAKGKRSERERDRDRDTQAKSTKAGRQINAKCERKTKAKPKQKTAQLPTSVNSFTSNSLDVKRETASTMPSNGNLSSDTTKENKESVDLAGLGLPIDSIDELDVPGWFNFDGDGLQDIDSAGLEIPMDDLSDVFL